MSPVFESISICVQVDMPSIGTFSCSMLSDTGMIPLSIVRVFNVALVRSVEIFISEISIWLS